MLSFEDEVIEETPAITSAQALKVVENNPVVSQLVAPTAVQLPPINPSSQAV